MNELTEEQMKAVRGIVAGDIRAPKDIRSAAVRCLTGYTDEYDTEMLTKYIDTL